MNKPTKFVQQPPIPGGSQYKPPAPEPFHHKFYPPDQPLPNTIELGPLCRECSYQVQQARKKKTTFVLCDECNDRWDERERAWQAALEERV